MKLSILLIFTVACNIIKDAYSQTTTVVTYFSNANQSIECSIEEGEFTVSWSDTQAVISLATYVISTKTITITTPDGKYSNFDYSANVTHFNLNIINVEEEDVGTYDCSQPISGSRSIYNVMVEVPPDEISLSCSSCTKEEDSCDCECSASGGSSPFPLRLQWKINGDDLPNQPPTENNTNNGNTVHSSSAVVPVTEDNSVVLCTVTGFENQDEIATQFPGRIAAQQTLSSPVCTVSVSGDSCPTVVLSCSCVAYPSVPDGPEYISYYTRRGKDDASNDTLLSTTSYVVIPGSNTHFLCSGDNGINFSTKSEAVPNPCKDGGLPGGIIAVICIVVIVVICVIVAVIVWCVYNNKPSSSKGNNSVRDDESPPVYGVIDKDKKKKSDDNTDGNGKNSTNSDPPEYAAVNKPLKNEPTAAPRSSAPSAGEEPEKMELQYADLDHGNREPSNKIHQPADDATEYATVQSVIV